VQVVHGMIQVSNAAGMQIFSAGQFGFASGLQPPSIVVPQGAPLTQGQSTPPTRGPSVNCVVGSTCNNFAAEQKSEIESQADEAFSALGYAKKTPSDSTPPPPPDRLWNGWVNVGGGGFNVNDTSGSGNDAKGNQTNVTVGVDRKIAPGTVVGILGGYEHLDYNVAALGASSKYDGETIGAYLVQSSSNLSFDAGFGWTNLNYNSAVGATGGSFIGSRWRATTGLTGNYILNGFVLQPSARAFMSWEHDGSWTDNAGNLTPANNVSAGRTALGALVARPFATAGGWIISPYAGLYGDWVFSSNSNNALFVGPPVAIIPDGWSGRVTAGLAARAVQGIVVSLGGEFGGLGASYKIWSGNLRAAVPF
jgi:hypothetical protein